MKDALAETFYEVKSLSGKKATSGTVEAFGARVSIGVADGSALVFCDFDESSIAAARRRRWRQA